MNPSNPRNPGSFGFQPSDFGLLSDFDLRPSDFHHRTHPNLIAPQKYIVFIV
jgi:hypothetical protein